ncbi:polyisoprenoid-binding protein [Novosphingobium sp. FSY-8]|uniref:Polyisoprenoid-binding protein n=1 Tax=Novosphingobium ovatum TaxID=1908523 RepID=A0ABW9XHW3_9SPHN|nr:YceI family protein [Novosphingobium ovatum]NBC38152.1 polyisoprenoid-binding protein [Novosphingobium ovatum]
MRNFASLMLAAAMLSATPAVVHAQAVGGNPAPAAAQGGTFKVDSAHTHVAFSVMHFGFSDWFGGLSGIDGSLTIDPKAIGSAKLDITIPAASITTANATLNEELRGPKFLDAAQFPQIRFVSTKVVKTGARTAAITGNLTFHGVTKPVVLNAVFNGGGVNPMNKAYTLGFNATTTISRSAFGVGAYVPAVADKVELRITAAFERP